jgi:teichuronic acid biosynthesis glycosyltransferase TuaC
VARLRVLALTTLFPSRADPGHAPFNRQQFAHLAQRVDLEVQAVVPWRFAPPLGRARSPEIARREWIDSVEVHHPRFATLRGLAPLNAALMSASVAPALLARRLQGARYDVVLGAYAYPDGVAAVLLAKAMGLPVVVKCHGSDLNRVPEHRPVRLQLQAVLPRADRVVVVSAKLGERAAALGVRPERIDLVYNGIDRERFRVRDAAEARRALGLPAAGQLVLYVGTLAEHKGAGDLLAAAAVLAKLRSEVRVVFVGDGPLAGAVAAAGRNVIAAGRQPHEAVARYMSACDLLCLPSWDEGLPNVVREAHASGRPVVATAVGGIPEAVHRGELGQLVPPRDPARLLEALLLQLDSAPLDPEALAALAHVPTWAESAAALEASLQRAVAGA